MVDTAHQLKPAPLSFEKTESQVAKEYQLVEVHAQADGTKIEVPKLGRKERRHRDAYDRRKFKPTYRPLNQRELREMYLNRYEDSLEVKKPRSQKRKPQLEVTAPELPALPLGTNRQARIARRAEIRRRAETGE